MKVYNLKELADFKKREIEIEALLKELQIAAPYIKGEFLWPRVAELQVEIEDIKNILIGYTLFELQPCV